jgi:hypothetical protein
MDIDLESTPEQFRQGLELGRMRKGCLWSIPAIRAEIKIPAERAVKMRVAKEGWESGKGYEEGERLHLIP